LAQCRSIWQKVIVHSPYPASEPLPAVLSAFYSLKSDESVAFELDEEGSDYAFGILASWVYAVCFAYFY
jgi:hypothetical protein